eukprot:CAMPEP_0202691798 /NCGR_PEP_ID=MMETSP1385-20130828/6403_1 /ASSEMBLY_ACC=CAM_ASM_000861 /TAXON_ID=933848 /ORGANISM="Elphidium margaritaceum" /LENGTH=1171 /DNA_ID=CAMNT_0049347251 /DNA_START=53 /DNA_END=3565 /DNA_ORIENTATION=-
MKARTRYSTQFTGQWEWVPTLNADDGPSARCGHTLTVHGTQLDHAQFITQYAAQKHNSESPVSKPPLGNTHGKLLVTFGESSLLASREYLNDIYLLDLATLRWVKILGKNIAKEYKPYMKVNFNPVARADHAATAFGNNLDQCLIFGGKCQDTYLSDLILVKNIANFPINRVEQEIYEAHENLGTRSSSSSSSSPATKQLYTDTPLRIESIHLRNGPSARRGASLTAWQGKGSFLLFGGQCGSLFFNDLWGLDLYKQGWVELATQRNPMERAFHSAFVDSQQQMLLLGGVRDTQANPVPPDIFKLDLRVGKFFKLGDKDMVPGVAAALSKGHHSSHFLSKKCDLAIFAPQNSAAYLLGGNVQSEHCGRCAEIYTFTADQSPLGACRPATALLESHHSLPAWRSLGCHQRPLERLFVFGGYSPSTRRCSRDLYSLKFSVETCKTFGHECRFAETPVIAAETSRLRSTRRHCSPIEEEDKIECSEVVVADVLSDEQKDEDMLKNGSAAAAAASTSPQPTQQQTPKRRCSVTSVNGVNVTPMRPTRRMQAAAAAAACVDATSDCSMNGGNLNSSMLCAPANGGSRRQQQQTEPTSTIKKRRKRVSLVPTPVRAASKPVADLTLLRMHDESLIANQKIVAIDRELTAAYNHSNDDVGDEPETQQETTASDPTALLQRTQQQQQQQQQLERDDDECKKPLHRQYIDHILLHFEESFLDPEASFILDPSQVLEIIHTALPLLEEDPILIRIEAPVKIFGDIHGQLGDLMNLFASFGCPDDHIGDLGYYKYIFLGDFVDRGHKSLEVMCLLLALKIEYPQRVFLIRGNHECHAMNEMYGFYAEISERLYPHPSTLKYLDHDVLNENVPLHLDRELSDYFARVERRRAAVSPLDAESETMLDIDLPFEMVDVDVVAGNDVDDADDDDDDVDGEKKKMKKLTRKRKRKRYQTRRFFRDRTDCITYLVQSFELTFRWLPLASLVQDKVLCVHGGIGQIERIEEIEQLQRPCDVVCDVQREMDEQQRRIVDLLWSDPAETDTDTGFQANKRGVSCVFGSDIVRSFCKRNSIDLIVRGHQVVKDGFEYFAGGHLITLFSATNYCNVMDNAGAILCIDENLRVIPKLVEPRKINMTALHESAGGAAEGDEEGEEEKDELDELDKHVVMGDDGDDDDDGSDNLQW